jgi:hypothetical protein
VGDLPFHRYKYLRRVHDRIGEEKLKAYERARNGDDALEDVDWDAERFSTLEAPG